MKLNQFQVLTFDCYGTLIDWETGLWNALQPLLSAGRLAITREEALVLFGELEHEQECLTPSLLYPSLLAVVHARLAERWGARVQDGLHERFGQSVLDWPAFPDSAAALAYLKRHYKLVILSNVDRNSFAHSNSRLGVSFDAVYTAEDIGSYKPDARNFIYLLEHVAADLNIQPTGILHTAQSLMHDHVPARNAGLACAWIDRRAGVRGGATVQPEVMPRVDFTFRSLSEMVERHRSEGTM